jgi:hypothetical protein
MERPEMSQVFDSDMQFLDAITFDEVVMNEVELFSPSEFDNIVYELQSWDSKSLTEMQESMFVYLQTRNGNKLKLAMNIVLDYCMLEGSEVNDFKVFLLTNTIEYVVSARQIDAIAEEARRDKDNGEIE